MRSERKLLKIDGNIPEAIYRYKKLRKIIANPAESIQYACKIGGGSHRKTDLDSTAIVGVGVHG